MCDAVDAISFDERIGNTAAGCRRRAKLLIDRTNPEPDANCVGICCRVESANRVFHDLRSVIIEKNYAHALNAVNCRSSQVVLRDNRSCIRISYTGTCRINTENGTPNRTVLDVIVVIIGSDSSRSVSAKRDAVKCS